MVGQKLDIPTTRKNGYFSELWFHIHLILQKKKNIIGILHAYFSSYEN